MQLQMRYKTWGGKRKYAGRKPGQSKPGVVHSKRPSTNGRHPLHVTLKVGRQIPNLRTQVPMRALRDAFAAGKCRAGFRLIHFSVQPDHVHMVIEADDRASLSRGVQGLSIRIARGINRAIGRAGRVFADRYHARALGTPREVRMR